MDTPVVVALLICLGAVLGAVVVLLLLASQRRGLIAQGVMDAELPDGVAQVLEAAKIPALVVDSSNNVVLASAPAAAMGLVEADARLAPQLVESVVHVRNEGERVERDLTFRRAKVELELSIQVARLGARYVLVLAEDRTEAIRVDQVRRDFLANISHELKTPISAILLLAETLKEVPDDPELTRRYARKIRKEARRLGRITNGIIELGRIQSADVLTTAQRVEVDELLASVLEDHEVHAEEQGVTISVRGDRTASVLGDRRMLETAVGNLLENAIDFSPEGGMIGIGVKHQGGHVSISVTDQGPGIPAREQERVFERFYRVDPSRHRKTGGTGLGLSIVKHVAQGHGGEARVWSQPGVGSTFTLVLPDEPSVAAPRTDAGEKDGQRQETEESA